MSSIESLKESIAQVGDKVRSLKISNADKAEIDAEVSALLGLKKQLAELTGESTGGSKKKGNAFTLKTPKGTKDYNDKEMAIREHIFSTIINVFKRHGGVTIDTPVFELRDILTGKYGEDSKLIYDLEDQGGEKCSLRYDLTVPFARFLAMNGTTYQNIKRYHIAKVYRRDQPAMTKGRMREFYQCDFDIAGTYEPMVPDSEVIRIVVEILTALDVGKFTIKVNHRKILDGLFEVCGVPTDKIRTISSAVDKLDKMPWADVRKEMTQDKGLDEAVADKIGEYVKLKGGRDLLEKLQQDEVLMANKNAAAGLEDMKAFLKYLDIFKVLEYVSFDLSLARGLDYYTGVIYEAVVEESLLPEITQEMKKKAKEAGDDDSQTRIGSVSAGGRYDNLVGMFAGGGKKSNIPCVGLSIGVERVFSIIMRRSQLESIKSNECEAYVIAVGDGLLEDRMKIATELWENGIKAEYMYKAKPKLQAQFSVCDRDRIPWAIIIGKDELEQGIVKIKDMSSKQQENAGGVTISRSEMIQELKKRLGRA